SWHSASTPSERQEEWSGWQIKYPTPSAKKNAKWQPLVAAIQAVSNSSDTEFCQRIGTLFDLPAVRDYYLLIELIFATDNSAKNMYWAIQDYQRDARLTPIPWDMDGTLGRNYAGSDHTSNATRDYRDFLRREGHQNVLFERLYKLDPNDWNAQMAKRYRQLRRTHFNPQRLSERITSLLHLMEQSGAHIREAQRWNNANGLRINIPQEAELLQDWITRRIAYLDTQYNM
ncbi:MAG: CotH kinase family protein, partial [Prevotellamassilia sp.]|nr:CotH kinase family protein [Prevotellamassilia sp.]